ncbi:ribose 5-phosphate isomerase B [Caproiciproducens sp. LBM24188]|jgi:ribose 5-phosphate isomerase B|nr:ribose 5-phosphate isomerase B [Oscillospiraceae bacterium]HHV32065.1 ribose 5-phosphate isomerase B [Clostridiales bacterium]
MIVLGADHGGVKLKEAIKKYLDEQNIAYKDFGTFDENSVDYAPIASRVANAIVDGEAERGFLCCGTGIGMSIAANKVKGIRASVCSDPFSAEMTRRHNNANILCLGGRVINEEKAVELAKIFLNTPFEGGRHQRRIDQIAAIERGEKL